MGLEAKTNINIKINMSDKHSKFDNFSGTTKVQNHSFASVYYYLFTGIILLVAVFLFLPRVSSSV
ncbi:hypothetical protein COV24_04690 [candidate division WWE3 bacterium CG10_big_fil_rev_8_21_14_0_10_32_10]|uniref:Uncharacterized protein n=1 Tax=candidate division WWE3 bacterium CG10_big_fil_rev_8_21_14_0_10_32_10 TaxID=1975090 RepID=A0A2H0R948_UNCKA|nr:MAG: hypothetical protein COV24_04690 [candidate division WWE3 bacterium CG10_big_fil_rev_8_21_14_0_10_32_10]